MRVVLARSASKHGVSSRDVRHALARAQVVEEVGEDPLRFLVLGPALGGDLLELVVLVEEDGLILVIHAMKMRQQYRRLLGER